MAKTKQTRRMITMALAASVATSAVPVTAVAETVDNGNGTSTITESNTTGAGTPESPKVTEVSSETKYTGTNVVTERTESKTTESTTRENPSDKNEVGKTSVSVTTTTTTYVSGTSTTEKKDEAYSEKTSNTQENPENTNQNPNDPTGDGKNADNQYADVNNNGQDAVDQFVGDFVEGTTTTTVTETDKEHHESHTESVDGKDRPTANYGSVSGYENNKTTVTTVEKNEQIVQEETTTVEKHVVVDKDGKEQIVVDEDTLDEMEDAGAFGEVTLTPDGEGQTDEMYEYQEGDELTANLNAPNDYEKVTKDLSDRYDAWVKANVTDPAAAAAAKYGDTDLTVTTSDDGKTFTGVKVNDDGSEIKKVVTVVEKTVDGKTVFETTTTTYYTPANGKTNEIVNPDHPDAVAEHETGREYTYDFSEVEETPAAQSKDTVIKLPEKPFEGEKKDETTGHTATYTVEEIKEMIDGKEQVVGYRQNVVLKDAVGNVVSTDCVKEVKGEITTTTESTKTVEKTTTIDINTQETVVTEKTVTKDVTVTTVVLDEDAQQRMLEAWLTGVGAGTGVGDNAANAPVHGTVTNNWLSPDSDIYDKIAKSYYTEAEWNKLSNAKKNEIKAAIAAANNFYSQNDLRVSSKWDEDIATAGQAGVVADWQWMSAYGENALYDHGWFKDGDNDLHYTGYGLWSEYLVFDKVNGNLSNYPHDVRMYEMTDENGNKYYGYCTELGQGLYRGEDYNMINIDKTSNFTFKGNTDEEREANKNMIRTIAINGFWGTTGTDDQNKPVQGSLDAVKQLLRDNRESHNLSDAEIDSLTAGQAMAATQVAIWKYGKDNGTNKVMDETFDSMWSYAYDGAPDAADSDVKKVKALYDTLTKLTPTTEKETELLDKEDIKGASIVVTDKAKDDQGNLLAANTDNDTSNDVYNSDVSFTLAVIPTENDDLVVKVYNGNTLVETRHLSGRNTGNHQSVTSDGKGNYTISGIQLQEGVNINLSIDGTQHLQNGVYIYQSDMNGSDYSQTFVGLNQGDRTVNLDINMKFEVDEPEATTSSASGSTSGKRAKRTTTDYHEQKKVLSMLVEKTTEVVTTESMTYAGAYNEEWTYNDGSRDPIPNPKTPDPTTPDPGMIIPDEDVPLADAPEDEGMVLGAEDEEDPMVLGEEEELIAATGDSNHMTAGFGGMLAALAGMFMLRRKKEN